MKAHDILLVFLGGAIGSAITYYKMSRSRDEELERARKEMKEHYITKTVTILNTRDSVHVDVAKRIRMNNALADGDLDKYMDAMLGKEKKEVVPEVDEEETMNADTDTYAEAVRKPQKVAYNKIVSNEEITNKPEQAVDADETTYEIVDDVHEYDSCDYEEVCLYWYISDDILADVDTAVMSVDETIGVEAMRLLQAPDGDDVIRVFNHRTCQKFEITITEDPYEES